MLENVGGVGLFQYLSFFIITCGISSISFIWFGIPLYTKQPIYKCAWIGDTPENPNEVCMA